MTFAALGAGISPIEVTNVSSQGFWVLLDAEELFLPFTEFPWFRDVAIGKILHVELLDDQSEEIDSRELSIFLTDELRSAPAVKQSIRHLSHNNRI